MQKYSVNTFAFVDKDSIPAVNTSDSAINRRFKLVEVNVEKGNAYSIIRSEYDYFMRMRYLEAENKRLRKDIQELKNKEVVVKPAHSRFEPWIDNGQPDESWREIHEMGTL